MKNIISTAILVSIFLMLSSCGGPACYQCIQYTPGAIMDNNDGGVADGATNVSLTPNIVLKFNQPFLSNNINQMLITLSTKPTTGNNPVAAMDSINISTIISNNDNTVFSFHPLSPLNPNTHYYVIVNGNIGLNNTITYFAKAAQFSFTTGSNRFPTVNVLDPQNGATNISTTPNIWVQFSSNVMNVNNNNVSIYEGSISGTQIPVGNITEGANNTYNINLKSPLKKSTRYYIFFSNFITNTNNNSLPQTSFTFTTGSNQTPSVNMLSPGNNSTNSSTSPIIQLQFSTAVKNVTAENVILSSNSSGSENLAISPITAGNNNTYTFSPLKPLISSNIYYVIIKNGIINNDNVNIQYSTFNFIPDYNISPTVNMISPTNNSNNVNNLPTLKFQFSESVQNVNPTNVIMYQDSIQNGIQIPISVQSSTNNTYLVTPTSALNSETTFYIVFNSGIIGNLNNALTPTTFTFTTINKKVIFVTANSYSGDLTATGGKPTANQSADSLCNIDSAKPNTGPLSTYKALLLTNDSSPANLSSWALQANSNYYNISNQLIAATTVNATLPDTLSNAISTSNVQVWTGAGDPPNQWEVNDTTLYCNNWNALTPGSVAVVGVANSTTSYFNDAIIRCDQQPPAHLYCVEQ